MKLKLIMNWNTMTWLYVTPFRSSGAMTAIVQRADRCDGCLVPRSIGCYDRYRYSAPIAVTIAAGYSGPLCISLAGGNGLPYKMLCKPLGGCHGLSRLS
ncbi:hypothetical protein L249_1508 [Ophiocordyceps polyrhachis-furcata BCC 54312]|uniref:Uncharacterized protein n=1 Tax=Ophiocordyceps polyrhachis-furcata BCC 54312 TaxID=1330021 RepID=A0A367L406_9HYPO|nr:hypothetical protein L249_1508 [Ophiocordyceps polyrhachis-furcata BCC 54312]